MIGPFYRYGRIVTLFPSEMRNCRDWHGVLYWLRLVAYHECHHERVSHIRTRDALGAHFILANQLDHFGPGSALALLAHQFKLKLLQVLDGRGQTDHCCRVEILTLRHSQVSALESVPQKPPAHGAQIAEYVLILSVLLVDPHPRRVAGTEALHINRAPGDTPFQSDLDTSANTNVVIHQHVRTIVKSFIKGSIDSIINIAIVPPFHVFHQHAISLGHCLGVSAAISWVKPYNTITAWFVIQFQMRIN